MTPRWGINWQCYHKDNDDLPHIERMGYAAFTTYEWMWSDRGFCADLLVAARTDALFLNRDHPLSEQKDDLWKNDPAQKGRNHADEWAQKVQQGRVFTPLDRTYFLGLNEPDSNVYQRQIDAYNEAYCRRMTEHGLRAAAYSFGVGHPSTVDLEAENPPDWHWYEASAAAVLEGHHIAAFHEYGAPDNYGWGYWCGRLAYCPHPFEVVLDECGIDHGVVDGNLYGYQIYMNPLEKYCDWLDGFQVGQAERAPTYKVKILARNIFGYDHGRSDSKDWVSYDIRPIRPAMEAYHWSEPASPTPTPPPVVTHLPTVGTGTPSPATPPPTVTTGIIPPQVARAILDVESGGRAFGEDGELIIRFEAHIFKAHLGNDALWAQHFRTDAARPWVDQMWRRNESDLWQPIHTGKQTDEHAAFDLAIRLGGNAAYTSISMGAAQIMGFNARRIGYPDALHMFAAFHDGNMQTLGFINYCLSDANLLTAMRIGDWATIARLYNGSGAVAEYSVKLEQAYEKLGAV